MITVEGHDFSHAVNHGKKSWRRGPKQRILKSDRFVLVNVGFMPLTHSRKQ
jgi:hypothetical protein